MNDDESAGHSGPMPVHGSRRSIARGHSGPQRAAKPKSLVLEIVCAPDGWPDHGEQVVIRWSGNPTPDQRASPPQLRSSGGGLGVVPIEKDEGQCPKCGARPRVSYKTVEALFEAMQATASGEPLKWRWDFRKRRLLS